MLLTGAVAIFLIAYILIASEKINRIAIVLCGAAVMLAIGASDFEKAFYSHDTGIDWNVIFLLLGMMIIVSIIHRTGLFEYLAIKAAQFSKGDPKKSLVYLAILTAVASAMLDNVTTILLAIPMTFVVCKKLSVTPVPFILVQVFASNIGGAATLIGDPPNIIIASKAGLSFNWFLTHMLPLVVVVLIVMLPVWVFMFRNSLVNSPADKAAIMKLDANQFLQNTKLLKKSLLVLTLVLIAFALHTVTHMEPAVIALFGAGVLVAISGLKPKDYLPEVEWSTLVFFMGLFIMVGALVNVGALAKFAEFLKDQFGGNLATASYSILGISAVLSGIVDNIPYVASMVPVVSELNAAIGAANPNALWTALAFGADFGGNATIIGASANVVAIALAKRQGIEISFWQFAKYGIITTLISVALVYPYLALSYLSA
jgi:Na+/H+ antiporter NhaD/arsenite permease-like protein